jgi:hypothetical protein
LSSTEHHETWLTKLKKGSCALVSDGSEVDTAIVFVHGFLGDAQGTWLNFQESICSQGASHSLWSKCDVFFFSYGSFSDDITESARALLTFVRGVFPKPPSWMFKIAKYFKGLPPSVLDLTTDMPTYKHLVLVGHSEGGIVIRRAVDLAYGKKMNRILMARLALFAPAHKGVKLSGWIGACLVVGRVDAVLMPFLNFSDAFVEMKQGNLLTEIENHTKVYREESKGREPIAFRAHVLFGSVDHVVQKGFYPWDCFHDSEIGKDHVSICKPSASYNRPIKFVLARVDGEEECTDSSSS